MVTLYNTGAYLIGQNEIIFDDVSQREKLAARFPSGAPSKDDASRGTIAYSIMKAHNHAPDMQKLKLKFDAMASHDITYVGIVQTARASGLESFPMPYVLTNCHNSLCAVGGTINEDDHLFGLSAAQKYGGIYVPAHQAVIHQYMREMMSSCGSMILGSDSHTRYGALGTMAIGEGGPELVKQLLSKTYDIDLPDVVAVYLTGSPKPGVGPQDVALAIIGAVFPNGGVKNKVLEFVGEGISSLSADFRIGIDVMTTETTCLSSIWATDEIIRDYFALHNRPQAFYPLAPAPVAYYDGIVMVDLSSIEPMIALPFHPSNTYTIATLNANLEDILNKVEQEGRKQLGDVGGNFNLLDKIKDGRLMTQQGIIAGCAGGIFENICAAADILGGRSLGDQAFALSVYPASQPINIEIANNGIMSSLLKSGAVMRTAFCGPCFGAGDVPANNTLSIRHATRNFPNREGSKPDGGQVASVALMDARSIAATALNGGILTAATDIPTDYTSYQYKFDGGVYKNRCYVGYKNPIKETPLAFGPNIADWPKIEPLGENLLLKVVSLITDPVTTTDELIPSGETSSYRSNPLKLAEFTLSRKDPGYLQRAKDAQLPEASRLLGEDLFELYPDFKTVFDEICNLPEGCNIKLADLQLGSLLYANKPGDGSAREQAASCQKVLGTLANIAQEYATKRYRSNLINWGMLPFLSTDPQIPFSLGDSLFIPGIRRAVINKSEVIPAYVIKENSTRRFNLVLSGLTDDERSIILAGCLINYYAGERQK